MDSQQKYSQSNGPDHLHRTGLQLLDSQSEKSMRFIPVTSVQNGRYSTSLTVHPSYLLVPPGSDCAISSRTTFLPADWVPHVHPEGAVYFVNAKFHAVTDSQLYDSSQQAQMAQAITCFQQLLQESNVVLPRDYEVFLLPEGYDKCRYYLVDHEERVQFWLEEVQSCELGLPPSTSLCHLKCILQEHYWTHTEFFPYRPLPLTLTYELIAVLRHARGDQMTSDYSTFPFDAEQCAKFIELINVEPKASGNTYLTCVIGRLWALVFRHRFDHYYGQECARLSRDQKRLDQPLETRAITMKATSLLLLNFPRALKTEFDALPTDNLLYAIHWKKFISTLKGQWKESLMMCIGLLIGNVGLLNISQTSYSTSAGLGSTILNIGGIFGSFAFLHKYSDAFDHSAPAAALHLHTIQHPTLGFEPIAAWYSVPKATVIWSLVLTMTEVAGIVIEEVGPQAIIELSLIVGCLVIFIILTRFLLKSFRFLSSKLHRFRHGKKASDFMISGVSSA